MHEKTLYQALTEAGIETDHHESDLYFPYTAESIAILARYPLHLKSATRFNSNKPPVGQVWIDVPFAFDPYYQR